MAKNKYLYKGEKALMFPLEEKKKVGNDFYLFQKPLYLDRSVIFTKIQVQFAFFKVLKKANNLPCDQCSFKKKF